MSPFLVLARQIHPGQHDSLDALCKRYETDNSRREKHGRYSIQRYWQMYF